MVALSVSPVPALAGTLRVPADKSITHRALLLAALSDRTVRIGNPLDSADTGATLNAVEACGAEAEGHLGGVVTISGRGVRGLRPSPAIDCANAGTLMRLLTGVLVGQRGEHVILDGDDSLRARPMARVARPLRRMGATVFTAPGGTPPVVVSGGVPLRAMRHELEVASAQVKSAILLAGMFAEGETWVLEPAPSRDHTERMLAAAGAEVLRDGGAVGVRGPVASLSLPDVEVPGDFSSAAFHLVAGALRGDPEVRLEGVNLNPGRTGLLAVMRRMGAEVDVEEGPDVAGEPCGTLTVRRAGDLRGTDVEPHEVPAMIDELPLVGLLAAFARGVTTVRGAAELRVKESDRVAAVVAALRGMGVRAEEREDGFSVMGAGRLPGGAMEAVGDHRLAMLGAVAGLASTDGVTVGNFDACAVSYPGFAADLRRLGAA
ncbi:MAG TPA: 3-phosphoshikimate 1-carboxyvinyltransferase [Miltoncostaeaceae bacterium]|nr:3-phosphoshikimate 1-carboxyvinyltransferase [Miltoncostaeaceae bacterium]